MAPREAPMSISTASLRVVLRAITTAITDWVNYRQKDPTEHERKHNFYSVVASGMNRA